jgi:hypothetical protein
MKIKDLPQMNCEFILENPNADRDRQLFLRVSNSNQSLENNFG